MPNGKAQFPLATACVSTKFLSTLVAPRLPSNLPATKTTALLLTEKWIGMPPNDAFRVAPLGQPIPTGPNEPWQYYDLAAQGKKFDGAALVKDMGPQRWHDTYVKPALVGQMAVKMGFTLPGKSWEKGYVVPDEIAQAVRQFSGTIVLNLETLPPMRAPGTPPLYGSYLDLVRAVGGDYDALVNNGIIRLLHEELRALVPQARVVEFDVPAGVPSMLWHPLWGRDDFCRAYEEEQCGSLDSRLGRPDALCPCLYLGEPRSTSQPEVWRRHRSTLARCLSLSARLDRPVVPFIGVRVLGNSAEKDRAITPKEALDTMRTLQWAGVHEYVIWDDLQTQADCDQYAQGLRALAAACA